MMRAVAPTSLSVARQQWLLLFISGTALGTEDSPLDPVRIQKGLFLLEMSGRAGHLYDFQPYNWGPFSAEIYRDLDTLVASGFVAEDPVPGHTWRQYRTTAHGESQARQFATAAPADTLDWLARARLYVTGQPFARLLRDIYRRFPQYAAQSLLE
jgi:hypothetical protein